MKFIYPSSFPNPICTTNTNSNSVTIWFSLCLCFYSFDAWLLSKGSSAVFPYCLCKTPPAFHSLRRKCGCSSTKFEINDLFLQADWLSMMWGYEYEYVNGWKRPFCELGISLQQPRKKLHVHWALGASLGYLCHNIWMTPGLLYTK